jgi:phosphatidylinositol-3,4,5-trisphosphate 3-phosphatase/dual-specificity protein phosphatase PTEN
MNSLRKLVSGNRRRMEEGNTNLDLTYITPNIIAMSYPSSGIEAMYRNPIEQVSAYLNERHGDKYWIINTSERYTYDGQRYFGNRVSNYHWPDHHGPPFNYIYKICQEAFFWIQSKYKADSSFLAS